MKKWTERIRCPYCGRVQDAEVVFEDGAPFADYTHQCEHCGEWITESEWNVVNNECGTFIPDEEWNKK